MPRYIRECRCGQWFTSDKNEEKRFVQCPCGQMMYLLRWSIEGERVMSKTKRIEESQGITAAMPKL